MGKNRRKVRSPNRKEIRNLRHSHGEIYGYPASISCRNGSMNASSNSNSNNGDYGDYAATAVSIFPDVSLSSFPPSSLPSSFASFSSSSSSAGTSTSSHSSSSSSSSSYRAIPTDDGWRSSLDYNSTTYPPSHQATYTAGPTQTGQFWRRGRFPESLRPEQIAELQQRRMFGGEDGDEALNHLDDTHDARSMAAESDLHLSSSHSIFPHRSPSDDFPLPTFRTRTDSLDTDEKMTMLTMMKMNTQTSTTMMNNKSMTMTMPMMAVLTFSSMFDDVPSFPFSSSIVAATGCSSSTTVLPYNMAGSPSPSQRISYAPSSFSIDPAFPAFDLQQDCDELSDESIMAYSRPHLGLQP